MADCHYICSGQFLQCYVCINEGKLQGLLKVLQNILSNKLVGGKNGKTLSNFPIEVSGRKCLKFGVSEFLSLLNLLPLRKNCTSTPGFRNIGVKYWVLVLKTLRVARIMDLSVVLRYEKLIRYLLRFLISP